MRHTRLLQAAARALAVQCLLAPLATAQHQPFVVHDTKPVITHGPYLVDPSETAVTIVWITDTPSHSAVHFGSGEALDQRAETHEHGMVPVGTVHAIRVTGLTPGRTYTYRAVSTRVVKVKPYWPEKGLSTESATHRFTTFDRAKPTVTFSAVTDTHEDVARINALMQAIDWGTTDFLVHTGDSFDWLDSEDQLFARWLDPIGRGLAHTKPLVYARGNHELRGSFARELFRYVPVAEGRFYFARDHGPVHLLVLDSGEDKPDSTNVYARLNRSEPYLAAQLRWLAEHARTTPRFASAPFRIAVLHQPNWGSMPDGTAEWRRTANAAGIDLVIAGHRHRFSRTDAGTDGMNFTTLVVGQDQVARVVATADTVRVVVRTARGEPVDSFTVARVRR